MVPQTLQTDVFVGGAGPAGATIARLLALGGRSVMLVDPLCSSLKRLEIIPPSASPILEALNLGPLLERPGLAVRCPGILRRWGSDEIQIDSFINHPGGRGFVIERSAFDEALLQEATNAGVLLIAGRSTASRKQDGSISLSIRRRQESLIVHARMIIDATGRPASLARRLGASRIFSERIVAERLSCIHRRASNLKPAWLEVAAERNGWSYSISGPDGRQESWRLRRIRDRVPTGCYLQSVDASSACLSSAEGNGWIAVGDAVTSFDPITSQGLVNALSTSLVAAGAILSTDESQSRQLKAYSEAVAATFAYSEAGRKDIYRLFP